MGTATCPACGAPLGLAAEDVCENCRLFLETSAGWGRSAPERRARTRVRIFLRKVGWPIVALLLGSWLLVGAIGLQWADSLTGGSNSAWAALIFGPAILGALAIWGVVLVVLVVGLAVALATRHDAMPPPAR
jgi:hypothetical protein